MDETEEYPAPWKHSWDCKGTLFPYETPYCRDGCGPEGHKYDSTLDEWVLDD